MSMISSWPAFEGIPGGDSEHVVLIPLLSELAQSCPYRLESSIQGQVALKANLRSLVRPLLILGLHIWCVKQENATHSICFHLF